MKKLYILALFTLLIPSLTQAYTVQPGDTPYGLWGKNWKTELASYGITDPRKLPVGLEVEEKLGATTRIKLTDPNSVTPYATTTPTAGMIPLANASGIIPAGFIASTTAATGSMIYYNGTDYQNLGIGTGGQSLKGGTIPAWGSPTLISSATTSIDTHSTTAETTLLSFSLPANYLTSGRAVRVKVYVTDIDVNSTRDFTIKAKYGSATLVTYTISPAGTTWSNASGYLQFVVMANGGTAAQVGVLETFLVSERPDATFSIAKTSSGTSSTDASTAQNIVITTQNSTNEASTGITTFSYVAELI